MKKKKGVVMSLGEFHAVTPKTTSNASENDSNHYESNNPSEPSQLVRLNWTDEIDYNKKVH